MALLNSKNYSGLANYSTALPREAGPFLNVFITGEPRDGQDVAKLQCMVDFDGKQYQENNKSELYFVIMYVKRFWEKVVTNNGRDSVVAFGWKDEPKLDDECRFKYIIAGLLLDPDNKFYKKMRVDNPEQETLVYFKCQGVKFQSAMDMMDLFSKKCDELTPLSDNTEFEKSVVTPRRFITKATVTTVDSNHGRKYTYKFEPFKKLADEVVVKFMDKAVEYSDSFDKQFDKSLTLSNHGGKASAPKEIEGVNPSFDDGSNSVADADADFQLDL